MRVLVVEDDDEQAALLVGYVERYGRERGVDLHVSRLTSAFPLADEDSPAFDMAFLDIGLPGINGLEAAQLVRQRDSRVPLVFVTDLAQYAVRGYEVQALDFVVKPVSYAQIVPRLDKMVRVARENARRTIVVTTEAGMRVVDLAQLVSVEVSRHDLYFHLLGEGEPLRRRGTMAAMAEELKDAPFVRISASCLANMDLIGRIDGTRLVMADGTELWFSRAKRKGAMDQIARHLGGGR